MGKWAALLVLGAAQFLMVLDTSVMNVAISTLVADFDTTVTQIQSAITFYALVMAALILIGAKVGDRFGRRRTFAIGILIYGVGSAITAVAQSTTVLMIGWSVLEGIGAALVLPALVALVASNYQGKDRATAFGAIGGLAGVGVAVGPILGGWVTTNLSWRLVFVGEVVVVILILLTVRMVADSPSESGKSRIDLFGGLLSALGVGLVVYGALQSSTWGILDPRNSPVEPLGFALTPFVVLAGLVLLRLFVLWERHVERSGREPLLNLALFKIRGLTSSVSVTLAQNVILAGLFFGVPLYLQVTLGLDAFSTGVKMLPVSIALLITSMIGSQIGMKVSPRLLIRIALLILLAADIIMLGTIQPDLDGGGFAIAMGLMGIGIGLMAAILGNLAQSSVQEGARSEAGGLMNVATQLGTSLGTAVIGAIIITGLVSSFGSLVQNDPQIPAEVSAQVEVSLSGDVSFLPVDAVRDIIESGEASPELTDALVDNYAQSQLDALRLAFFAVGVIILFTLLLASALPKTKIADMAEVEAT